MLKEPSSHRPIYIHCEPYPCRVRVTLPRSQSPTARNSVEVLASGEKPASQWRIGTEHEKFGFRLDDLRPPTFDDERGIEALLTGMTRFGWTPVQEHDRTIALLRGDTSITLEPAGQLELAGAP